MNNIWINIKREGRSHLIKLSTIDSVSNLTENEVPYLSVSSSGNALFIPFDSEQDVERTLHQINDLIKDAIFESLEEGVHTINE